MKINITYMNINIEKYLDNYRFYNYPSKQKSENKSNSFDDILKKEIEKNKKVR